MANITKKDWTLLAIASAAKGPMSPVQLQKVLFLFGQNMPTVARPFYKFRPYNYGPFDSRIYADASELAASGAVTVSEALGHTWVNYSATQEGIARANELKDSLPKEATEYLVALVRWVQSLSFPDLLRAVYEKYPEFAVNSVFRGK